MKANILLIFDYRKFGAWWHHCNWNLPDMALKGSPLELASKCLMGPYRSVTSHIMEQFGYVVSYPKKKAGTRKCKLLNDLKMWYRCEASYPASLQLMYSHLNELTVYAGVLYTRPSFSSWYHIFRSFSNLHLLACPCPFLQQRCFWDRISILYMCRLPCYSKYVWQVQYICNRSF